MKFSEIQKQIIELIKRNNHILILPSLPVDGDSIGSALSLYIILKKLGKDVTVVCSDPNNEVLNFLPKAQIIGGKLLSSKEFIITIDTRKIKIGEIKSAQEGDKLNIVITPQEGRLSEEQIAFNEGQEEYDLIITVDTADMKQLGKTREENPDMFHEIPIINIDHHVSNEHYGKVNYVDIMSASTTELLLPLFEKMEEEFQLELIDEEIATLLLTGIITDTGSFQNSNTTPKAFAHAAQLIAYGAKQQEIIQHIYKTKQLSQLKLWGRVLSKIQVDEKFKIVWSSVSQQDFKDTMSKEEETGDIIDELMTNAPGAEVILLLKEKSDGTISGSVRTTNPAVDASAIAEMFGGGGHGQAAGFKIKDGNFREKESEIVKEIKEYQKNRLGVEDSAPEGQRLAAPEPEPAPLIDVKRLIAQAKEAEKAQESMPTEKQVKKYKKELKLSEDPKEAEAPSTQESQDPDPDVIYKFED
jgi:phosphoesterase RecJ-like protein